MVHPHLTKQKNYYTASFALLQFSTQFLQQALNINPLYVTANRATEDQFEGLLVLAFHVTTSTIKWYHNVPLKWANTGIRIWLVSKLSVYRRVRQHGLHPSLKLVRG